jgi:hypothetical protein
MEAFKSESINDYNIFQGNYKRALYLLFSFIVWFIVMAVGGGIVAFLEGWSFIDGIWYAVETGTTLGFGDFCTTTTAAIIFEWGFIWVAIWSTAHFLDKIVGIVQYNIKRRDIHRKISTAKNSEYAGLTQDIFNSMLRDARNERGYSSGEFLMEVLVANNQTTRQWCQHVLGEFDRLNVNNDSHVAVSELLAYRERLQPGATYRPPGGLHGAYERLASILMGKGPVAAQPRYRPSPHTAADTGGLSIV